MKKVFIASRFEEFKYIRRKLKEELLNRGMEVIDLNDNMADVNPPIARSLEKVRESEIIVLLVGDTYGTIPPGRLKSYTHLEYEEALKTQKNIKVFCIGESYFDNKIDYSLSQNMEEWQRQLENNHTLSFYDSKKSKDMIIDGIIKSIYKKPEPLVWIDEDTGLMWQVKVQTHEEYGRYPWDEIFNYTRDLNTNNYGGFDDWRVPSFDELNTLMTEKSYPNNDSSDGETFIKKPLLNSMTMKYGRFWSETSNHTNKKLAFGVNFNRIREDSLSKNGNKNKYQTRYIRCVRLWKHDEIETAWNKINASPNLKSIETFLEKYSDSTSKYINKAKKKLDELRELHEKEKESFNSLSPTQQRLFTLQENDKNIPLITLLFNGIENGTFDTEKCEALKTLKEVMKEENKWKEVSTKKNPSKDKEHQRTLKVIEWLKEC